MGCVACTFPAVEPGPALPMGSSRFQSLRAALGLIWPWSELKLAHLTLCLSFLTCSGSLLLGSRAVTYPGTLV